MIMAVFNRENCRKNYRKNIVFLHLPFCFDVFEFNSIGLGVKIIERVPNNFEKFQNAYFEYYLLYCAEFT